MDDFRFQFWGVRGSIPSPGTDTIRYGGNTSCVEVWCGDRLVILDCGTGLRGLGRSLIDQGTIDADILLSHTHLDHVVGFPFFVPFFHTRNNFRLWAGHLMPDHNLRDVLSMMMTEPLFPVPIELIQANLTFLDFRAGESFKLTPDILVHTAPLNHPNNATGYRIDFKGKSLCYITDTEHIPGQLDPAILELIDHADYVIYDAMFTDSTFPNFKGWGHSTWQQGVRLCNAANAAHLIVFHHDPIHNDEFLDSIYEQANSIRPGTMIAHEGMVIDIASSRLMKETA